AHFTPSASTLLTKIDDPSVTHYRDTTAAPGQTFSYVIVESGLISHELRVTLPADGHASKDLQLTASDGASTSISSQALDGSTCLNAGGTDTLAVGNDGVNTHRGLLRFDLLGIPTGSAITSASLSLWHTNQPQVGETVEARPLTADWSEGTGLDSCTGDGAS